MGVILMLKRILTMLLEMFILVLLRLKALIIWMYEIMLLLLLLLRCYFRRRFKKNYVGHIRWSEIILRRVNCEVGSCVSRFEIVVTLSAEWLRFRVILLVWTERRNGRVERLIEDLIVENGNVFRFELFIVVTQLLLWDCLIKVILRAEVAALEALVVDEHADCAWIPRELLFLIV